MRGAKSSICGAGALFVSGTLPYILDAPESAFGPFISGSGPGWGDCERRLAEERRGWIERTGSVVSLHKHWSSVIGHSSLDML